MKEEYDFTDAEQGKFYRPIQDLDIPIYLDQEVKEFLLQNIQNKDTDFSLTKLINSLLLQDIEISKKLILANQDSTLLR